VNAYPALSSLTIVTLLVVAAASRTPDRRRLGISAYPRA